MTQMLDKEALAKHWEGQCNRYMNGECQTRRCLVRGGYPGTGPVDYSIATCEEHESATIIRASSIPEPDYCGIVVTDEAASSDEDAERLAAAIIADGSSDLKPEWLREALLVSLRECDLTLSRLSAEPEAVTLREAGLIERLAVSVDAFVLVHTNDAELAINAGNHVREAAADHRAALTNVSSRAPK